MKIQTPNFQDARYDALFAAARAMLARGADDVPDGLEQDKLAKVRNLLQAVRPSLASPIKVSSQ